MDNRAKLGLADGFARGFGLMNSYVADKEARQRKSETFEHQKKEWQRAEDARLVSAFQAGIQNGSVDPKIAGEFGRRFDVDWKNYIDPDFGNSLNILEEAAAGKRSIYNDEFRDAFGRVFKQEISKGIGEQVDDRTIKEKLLRGVYPSKDKTGLMIDLDILEDTKEGERWRSAPVTTNRSAGDSEVKTIPLDKVLEKLKGHRLMYEGIKRTPELSSYIKQLAAKTGAQLDKSSEDSNAQKKFNELITLGVDKDKAMQAAYGLETVKPKDNLVINDQLVNPESGKVLGDYRSPEKPDKPAKPLVVKGRVLDPESLEVLADYSEGDGGSGKGGALDSSVMSQIQQSAKNFHGRFNPESGIFGFPEGAAEKYTLAMERTQKLIGAGIPVFKAINMANLSVADPLTPQKAKEIAEAEANTQDIGFFEKDKWIQKYSRDLLNKQNAAIEQYKRFEQQQGQSTQDTPVNKQSGKIIRTPQQEKPEQTKQPKRNAAAEAKLNAMLKNAKPEQIEAIKQAFTERMGYLPEGI